MPTPAPAAPRPPPMPSATALPAFEPASVAWARWVMTARSTLTPWLVPFLGDGAAQVDRGERGEDEGLQRRHKPDFEEEERDAGRNGDPPEGGDPEQDGERAGHEEDDQVPRQDVGEETHGERDQAHEVGEDLQREDQQQQRAFDALRDEALEVPDEAVRPHALDVVGEPDDQRER